MTEPEFITAAAGPLTDRYRLHHPDRKQSVELLVMDLGRPWGRFVGVFRNGKLDYGAQPGWVSMYLQYRGYEFQDGLYAATNRVPIDC